jgi:hypothetical protein
MQFTGNYIQQRGPEMLISNVTIMMNRWGGDVGCGLEMCGSAGVVSK